MLRTYEVIVERTVVQSMSIQVQRQCEDEARIAAEEIAKERHLFDNVSTEQRAIEYKAVKVIDKTDWTHNWK